MRWSATGNCLGTHLFGSMQPVPFPVGSGARAGIAARAPAVMGQARRPCGRRDQTRARKSSSMKSARIRWESSQSKDRDPAVARHQEPALDQDVGGRLEVPREHEAPVARPDVRPSVVADPVADSDVVLAVRAREHHEPVAGAARLAVAVVDLRAGLYLGGECAHVARLLSAAASPAAWFSGPPFCGPEACLASSHAMPHRHGAYLSTLAHSLAGTAVPRSSTPRVPSGQCAVRGLGAEQPADGGRVLIHQPTP